MRTGPQNEQLQALITQSHKKGYAEKTPLWVRVYADLNKSTRNRRVVNLSRINRYTKDGETVVVPGKVLSAGELDHPVTIAAWKFSTQALEKIAKARAKAIPLDEFIKTDINGKQVRILG